MPPRTEDDDPAIGMRVDAEGTTVIARIEEQAALGRKGVHDSHGSVSARSRLLRHTAPRRFPALLGSAIGMRHVGGEEGALAGRSFYSLFVTASGRSGATQVAIGSCLVVAGSSVVGSTYLTWVSAPNGCSWPGNLMSDGRVALVIGGLIAALGLVMLAVRVAQRPCAVLALLLTLVLGVIVRLDTKHLASFCSSSASHLGPGLLLFAVATCIGFVAALVGVFLRPARGRDWRPATGDQRPLSRQRRSTV